MLVSEQYVIQLCCKDGDRYYVNVRPSTGDYSTSSYLDDIEKYKTLELAKLGLAMVKSQHKGIRFRILKLTMEEVEDENKV